jgi:hypothetical protein
MGAYHGLVAAGSYFLREQVSADAAVFGEEGIEESVERAGAVMNAAAGLGEVAVQLVEFFFGAGELIGDVERSEYRNAQGIDGLALRRDEAHLGVDYGGELVDVFRVLAAQAVILVEDLNRNG